MPSAEELEQMLDETRVIYLKSEAEKHHWTDEELERMLKMEACKARGREDGNR